MRQPAILTGPIGTPEKLARTYGVPMRRAKELIRMVEESLEKKAVRLERVRKSADTNGRNGGGSRSYLKRNAARANGKAGAKSRKPSPRKAARAKAKKPH